jgi:hypothetical protein
MTRSVGWDRVGAISGIAFGALVIAGLTVWLGRDQDVTPASLPGQTAIIFSDRSAEIKAGTLMIVVAVFFQIWFLAYLWDRLREQERSLWFPSVMFAGGIVAAAMLLAMASLGLAAAVTAQYETDFLVVHTILTLRWDHLSVLAAPLAAMVAGTAAAGVRSGVLPAWLGWLSFPLVVGPVLLSGQLMIVLFMVWVIVVSTTLLAKTFSENAQ